MVVLAQNVNMKAATQIIDDPRKRLMMMQHQQQKNCELIIICIRAALNLMRGRLETMLRHERAKGNRFTALTAFCRLLKSLLKARQGLVREALHITTETIHEVILYANACSHIAVCSGLIIITYLCAASSSQKSKAARSFSSEYVHLPCPARTPPRGSGGMNVWVLLIQ
jgi:hypothetical protein